MLRGLNFIGTAADNFLLIVSAPSGAGKTTICNLLKNQFQDDLKSVISCTTRAKRPNEIDGVHYFFKDMEEFLTMEKQSMFAETAEVFGNRYGKPIKSIDDILSEKKNVLVEIDWQGKESLEKLNRFKIISIFIMPPSLEEVKNRLKLRGEPDSLIESRCASYEETINKASTYDFVIKNEDVNYALTKVKAIYIVYKIILNISNKHFDKNILTNIKLLLPILVRIFLHFIKEKFITKLSPSRPKH